MCLCASVSVCERTYVCMYGVCVCVCVSVSITLVEMNGTLPLLAVYCIYDTSCMHLPHATTLYTSSEDVVYALLQVQRRWRGFYTRKYIHNFYAMKRYLEGLMRTNELVR